MEYSNAAKVSFFMSHKLMTNVFQGIETIGKN